MHSFHILNSFMTDSKKKEKEKENNDQQNDQDGESLISD